MSWNDWEVVWRRQQAPIGDSADIDDLIESFEAKRRKLAVMVFARNASEGGTGLFLMPVFIYLSVKRWPHAMPLIMSTLIMVAVSAVFIADQIRAWRARVDPSASLLTKVSAEIAELDHQHRLFRRWWAWYLGPLFVAIVLGFYGLWPANDHGGPPDLLMELLTTPTTAVFISLFFAIPVLGSAVVWRSMRKGFVNIQRRIDELEKIKSFLTGRR